MIGLLPGESPTRCGVFENSRCRYGYRRVHLELRGVGVVVSAKRVMRLMARHGLVPVSRSARRYSSYRGEIGEVPVIHSDRGCHYRWPEWIRICKGHGLTRSMSAKGCSPGNAAVEGFFGHLKQEFFHKRDFTCVTVDGFADDARRVHDMVPRRTHQDRVRDEHHGQAHQAGARRLNTCDNLPDNHTDNEVQQNVATPELVMGLLWGGRGTGEWLGVEASHQCELHACSFPHDVENFVDNLGISWV